jgi:hypothetical protein
MFDASKLPRCVAPGCSRTATRGIYGACLCFTHGTSTRLHVDLAPCVTPEMEELARAYDAEIAELAGADTERTGRVA